MNKNNDSNLVPLPEDDGLDTELGDLFSTLGQVAAPMDFAAATMDRFNTARRKQTWRLYLAMSGLAVLLSTPMLWWLVLNFTSVIVQLADLAIWSELLSKMSLFIWNTQPLMWISVVLVSAILLLSIYLLQLGMTRTLVPVKTDHF